LVDLERGEDVVVVRLRGGKANALTPRALELIDGVFEELAHSGREPIVLAGDGTSFSAGLSLPELIGLDRGTLAGVMELFERTLRRVLTSPRATVAAIGGHAIGGGCALALMCDARLAAIGGAMIGLNDAQLGLALPPVVLEPLRLRVPVAAMVPVALEGRLFAPIEARAVGLVDELVPAAELERRAIERARELGRMPVAYAHIKRSLLRPVLSAMDRHGSAERDAWLDSWFAEPAQRTLRATVERITRRS
jgi:enoyl-CoA hydratase